MASTVDPSQWTYTDYVKFLTSHGFPNLSLLDEYLDWGLNARNSPQIRQPEFSRTMLLEFSKASTRISDLSDLNKLRLLLREWTRVSKQPSSPGLGHPSGRIVMVENAAPALIDTLGGLLNIDPSFFANHLDDSNATSCPISLASQEHFTVDYYTPFIPVNCPKEAEELSLHCKGNYHRKVELIPKQPRQKVALARRKLSIYYRPASSTAPWLAVVLVDPSVSTFTAGPTSFGNVGPSQSLSVLPYRGGYVDFVELRKPHSKRQHDYRDCQQRPNTVGSTFDDLLRYWQISARDGLFTTSGHTHSISLQTIMRAPLQLAAAEMGNLFNYLSSVLATSGPASICSQHPIPNTLTLQRALARTIAVDALLSTLKPALTRTKDFLSSLSNSSTQDVSSPKTPSSLPSTSAPSLTPHYRSLLTHLHHLQTQTESTSTHLTALLTSAQSNNIAALTQTTTATLSPHLRILLTIALLYIPLSLACMVFSLPASFVPSAHYLYGFLPVAAAVSLVLLAVGLPEARQKLGRGWDAVRGAICGGLTKERVLAGERFKRSRETGVRERVRRVDASEKPEAWNEV